MYFEITRKRKVLVITTTNIRAAYTVALLADTLQMVLAVIFPPSWIPSVDNLVDVIVMFLLWKLVGFHYLLLPSLLLELTLLTVLPTWTACLTAVIQIRKRAEQSSEKKPLHCYLL